MSQPPPAPELVGAYQLLKAGQRREAGAIVKAYLNAHPRDANAWWLMSFAVTKPPNIRTCLERAVRIDPQHAQARARLERYGDEPPSDAILRPPDLARAPAPEPTAAIDHPLLAPDMALDSLDIPPEDNPLADLAHAPFNPFAETYGLEDAAPSEPIAPSPPPGPLRPDDLAQLAAVYESVPAIARPAPAAPRRDLETRLGIGVLLIALLAAIAAVVIVLNERGTIHLWGGSESSPAASTPMTTLEASTFTLAYPAEWSAKCYAHNTYPVCGVGNHYLHNFDVDEALDMNVPGVGLNRESFWQGPPPPPLRISAVAMDVSLPIYQTLALWAVRRAEEGPDLSLETAYESQTLTLGEHQATYERVSATTESGASAVYDVRIEHDAMMFWLHLTAEAPPGDDIPEDAIQALIRSIRLRPLAEWATTPR